MRRSNLLHTGLFCLVALQIAATIPLSLLMAGPASAGRPALVLLSAWGASAAQVLAQTGGRQIAPVPAPLAVLAVLDHPDLARQAGAWAVLDAGALAYLCTGASS